MAPTTCGMELEIRTEHVASNWVTTVPQLNLTIYGASEAEVIGQVDPVVFAFLKNFVNTTNDVHFEKLHVFLKSRAILHKMTEVKARFNA